MTNGHDPGDPGIQRVTLSRDVLRAAPVAAGREVPPLTRIGYRLAVFFLLYLSVVTLFLLVEYWAHAPSLPSGPPLDETQLVQYQHLSQLVFDRTVKLIDLLVLKGFLPVLTAVLGYIFGTRGAEGPAA